MAPSSRTYPFPPKPPPAPPTPQDPAVLEARNRERSRLIAASGRRSTILTSGAGVTTKPTLGTPALLGGARY